MTEPTWTDLKIGPGPQIREGDTISILYTVHVWKGSETVNLIETTFSPDVPISIRFDKGQILEGMRIGMNGMRSGGGNRLINIPSDYAYGRRPYRNIPAGSDLQVLVSVIDVLDTSI